MAGNRNLLNPRVLNKGSGKSPEQQLLESYGKMQMYNGWLAPTTDPAYTPSTTVTTTDDTQSTTTDDTSPDVVPTTTPDGTTTDNTTTTPDDTTPDDQVTTADPGNTTPGDEGKVTTAIMPTGTGSYSQGNYTTAFGVKFEPIENGTKVRLPGGGVYSLGELMDDDYIRYTGDEIEIKNQTYFDEGYWRLLLDNQVYRESRGVPGIGSSAGAQGLGQITPGTWKDVQNKYKAVPQGASPFNPEYSIRGQEAYMNALMNESYIKSAPTHRERVIRALIAYNWGPGNAKDMLAENGPYYKQYKSILPKETQDYITEIMGRTDEMAKAGRYKPIYIRNYNYK